MESVSDEQMNVKKLMLGRIDLWVTKQPGLKTVCDQAGIDSSQLKEVFHLRERDLCIAFSKKTSDLIVQRWRKAFNDMLDDRTVQKIHDKWNSDYISN